MRLLPFAGIGALVLALVAGCSNSARPAASKDGTRQSAASADPSRPASISASSGTAPPTVQPTSMTVSPPSPPCPNAAQALAIATKGLRYAVAIDPDHGFACANGWAYVNYHQVQLGNHATRALLFVHGKWIIGNRLVGCGYATHPPAMPPTIQAYGCGN